MRPIDYTKTIRSDGSPIFEYRGLMPNKDMDLLLVNENDQRARVKVMESIVYDFRCWKIDLYGPDWESGETIYAEDIRRFEDIAYEALNNHTASSNPKVDTTNWKLASIDKYDLTVLIGG
jgi:hypothetical protein